MTNSSTLPPGRDLHECTGRAQGLVGLQCVFVCCMSWKTQITKVLISERTWGPCSFLALGGFSGQSPLPSFRGNCFYNFFVGALDRGHVSSGSQECGSSFPSPFPDAPAFPFERNSLDSEPAPAPWHWWQTRPEVQIQPELLQMSTECSQDRHTVCPLYKRELGQ